MRKEYRQVFWRSLLSLVLLGGCIDGARRGYRQASIEDGLYDGNPFEVFPQNGHRGPSREGPRIKIRMFH